MVNFHNNTIFGNIIKLIALVPRLLRVTKIKLEVKRTGNHLRVVGPVFVSGGRNISIGKNCFIGRQVVIDASHGSIDIGDNCELRDFTRIYGQNIRIGHGVTLGENSFLNGKISLADGAWISRNCDLTGDVVIEKAIIGPGVACIGSSDHARDPSSNHALMGGGPVDECHSAKADILIERGSWIGQNAIILKGVKIGQGAIVGAGSIVTRDVRKSATVAGNPAKEIG